MIGETFGGPRKKVIIVDEENSDRIDNGRLDGKERDRRCREKKEDSIDRRRCKSEGSYQ